MIVKQLVDLCAPWQALYSNSRVVPIVTEGAHLLAMMFGGGFAVAADRATLRAARRGFAARAEHLHELHQVHRPVLIALSVAFVTGIALAAADVETFAASEAFWIKLGLVALLLANGWLFMRTELALQRAPQQSEAPRSPYQKLWRRLRLNAVSSIVLWSATLIAGVVLVNVA